VRTHSAYFLLSAAASLLLAGIALARPQDPGPGPIAPPPKFEVKRMPSETPEAPAVPAEEIIRRFTANEDKMKAAYDHFTFTQSLSVKELSTPGGEYDITGEFYTKPDGQRFERFTGPPESTLKVTSLTIQDVKILSTVPSFVLTTNELANYNLQYLGTEKLDELKTYIFRVKPKHVERMRRFFDGVVWVDDHDFAVVKSSGRFVSEIADDGTGLPFRMFDMYRENVDGKYWLPTYIGSDDFVKVPNHPDIHLRLVIRSSDFKPEVAPAAGAADPPAAAPVPGSPPTETPATPVPAPKQ
jgi:hypothetical protein